MILAGSKVLATLTILIEIVVSPVRTNPFGDTNSFGLTKQIHSCNNDIWNGRIPDFYPMVYPSGYCDLKQQEKYKRLRELPPNHPSLTNISRSQFGYHGGPLIVNPKVTLIYVRREGQVFYRYNDLKLFYKDMSESDYFAEFASEYSVPEYPIGKLTINPQVGQAIYPANKTELSETDILQSLQKLVENGVVEPPAPNHIYQIHLAIDLDITSTISNEKGKVKTTETCYCGYHSFVDNRCGDIFPSSKASSKFNGIIHYTMIKNSFNNNACAPNTMPYSPNQCEPAQNTEPKKNNLYDDTDQLSLYYLASHELMEHISNPFESGWQGGSSKGYEEIGDACNGYYATFYSKPINQSDILNSKEEYNILFPRRAKNVTCYAEYHDWAPKETVVRAYIAQSFVKVRHGNYCGSGSPSKHSGYANRCAKGCSCDPSGDAALDFVIPGYEVDIKEANMSQKLYWSSSQCQTKFSK